MHSEHFSVKELECPTSKEIKLADGFIDQLETLRTIFNSPMSVQSGCRSNAHNKWLLSRSYPASMDSFHLIENVKYGCDTCAVDIAWPKIGDRHRFMDIATSSGWSIGIAKTFIHIDRRIDYTDLKPAFYQY